MRKGKVSIWNLIKKSSHFLITWRPISLYEWISYFLMFASVPMLGYGIRAYDWSIVGKIFLTAIVLYSGFFAALIWNDINDLKIDRVVHPDRPLPSGRIGVFHCFSMAVIFSAMAFIFSLLINWMCFILVVGSALFVALHNKYLKSRIRIPAYSEIFTPLQWVIVPIFGFLAVKASLSNIVLFVLFTYFADNAHDLPEGIHDREGDESMGIRTYATSFGERTTAKISFGMFFISGIFGIFIYFYTILTELFLILFLLNWIYILFKSFELVRAKEKLPKNGARVGKKGFNYFLIAYDLIFLDLLLQLIIEG